MPPAVQTPESSSSNSQSLSPRVHRSEILIQTKWKCKASDFLSAELYDPEEPLSNAILQALADIADYFGRNEARKALVRAIRTRPGKAVLTLQDVEMAQRLLKQNIRSRGDNVEGEDDEALANKRKRDEDRRRDDSGTPRESPSKRRRGIAQVVVSGTKNKTRKKRWTGWVVVDSEGNEVPDQTYKDVATLVESDELAIDSTPSRIGSSKSRSKKGHATLQVDHVDSDETDVSEYERAPK